jgi:membrane protein
MQSWRTILQRSMRQFKRDNITDRAAALTYYGVLAIFPGLLVLISIMGMIGRHNAQAVLDNLQAVAPSGVNSFLRTVIEQVQGRAGAASIAAVAGLIIALWSASAYVAAFMRALNGIYGVEEGRPVWRTVPVRLGVTLLLVVMLVASALIVVVTGPVARQVGHALGIGNAAVTAWNIAKWPVLFILVCLMISLLYWATPNVKHPGVRWITPGGALAVLIWLIASGLFAVYVAFSGSYNKTYGSLATVIIFLVWLWLSNVAILLGAEVNAESERQRGIEAGLPDHIEPYLELRDTRKLDSAEKRRVEQAGSARRRLVGSDTRKT